MPSSREVAHQSFRDLWEVVDRRLREQDAIERETGEVSIRRVETELGATICSYAGALMVSAEFEKPDSTIETVEVIFPEDIRDLSRSLVIVDWFNAGRSGTNTPALREFPAIARDLLSMV